MFYLMGLFDVSDNWISGQQMISKNVPLEQEHL